jgi:hypothetical protein
MQIKPYLKNCTKAEKILRYNKINMALLIIIAIILLLPPITQSTTNNVLMIKNKIQVIDYLTTFGLNNINLKNFTSLIIEKFQTPVLILDAPPAELFQAIQNPQSLLTTIQKYNPIFHQVKIHPDGRPFISRSLDEFIAMNSTELFSLLAKDNTFIRTSMFVKDLPEPLNTILPNKFFSPIEILDVKYESIEQHFFRPHLLKSQHALWLSSKGCITSVHFDELHNFYVQIYGTKRFRLLPPEKWPAMYMWHRISLERSPDPMNDPIIIFPPARSLHSAAGFETVRAKNPSSMLKNKYPRFFSEIQPSDWIHVDLKPGHVLYIPPNWFHEVEATSQSISLNSWTGSWEIETLHNAWKLRVPFNFGGWTPSKIIMGLTYLVRSVAARVLLIGGKNNSKFDPKIVLFAKDVLTRYELLYETPVNISNGIPFNRTRNQVFKHFDRSALEIFCVSTLHNTSEVGLEYFTVSSNNNNIILDELTFTHEEIQLIDDTVESIGKYFDAFKGRQKNWFLSEFLEQPLSTVLGFPGVVWFYEDCLSKPVPNNFKYMDDFSNGDNTPTTIAEGQGIFAPSIVPEEEKMNDEL